MDARDEISRNDETRDSPRLFAESEEVCRYKYNGFLSHRLARGVIGWLSMASETDGVFASIRTRISTSWNLPLQQFVPCERAGICGRFRVERVPRVSLSNQPNPRRSRSRLLFLRTAAFRRERRARVQRTGKYIEKWRSSM